MRAQVLKLSIYLIVNNALLMTGSIIILLLFWSLVKICWNVGRFLTDFLLVTQT
jgi:hypothetical protein